MTSEDEPMARPWATPEPGRLVGRGHPAGDFLEAWAWEVLEEGDGYVRVSAHLPDHVRNPRGQLFGGFTPTYVDLIALFTVRSRAQRSEPRSHQWLATTSMRVDYFEPIIGPTFVLDSRREKQRGRTHFVMTRFLQDGELAVLAATTMREVKLERPLGDA
ncbi:MAG TPA: PaaI family thioesterase [Jatrophihabitantaceae bacterium]|nr:PaaI family thioesterase [Jatrophihabitantaceae bacterium]